MYKNENKTKIQTFDLIFLLKKKNVSDLQIFV